MIWSASRTTFTRQRSNDRVTEHERYLATLTQWLRENKFPGDRERLVRTLILLRKLDVKIGVPEREELLRQLTSTFEVKEAELEELFPELERIEPPRVCGEERGELPPLSPLLDAYLELRADSESPSSYHVFAL